MHSSAWLRIAAAPLVLSTFAVADPAAAGTLVPAANRVLLYEHVESVEDGDSHDVAVEQVGSDYLIADRGRVVVADPDTHCVRVALGAVRCPAAEVAQLWIALGDVNDRVTSAAALPLVVCGGTGADVIAGGSGRDMLAGGPGPDDVYGNDGNDLVAITLDPDLVNMRACAAGAGESLEVLDGGPGPDQVHGGAGNDVIRGGDGADSLLGFAGDDRLDAGDGRDDVHGLAGDDVVDGSAGNDLVFGGPGDDRLLGGAGDDDLGRTVRIDANGLERGEVDATVTEAGNDRLLGGEGNDALVAGPGEYVLDFLDPLSSLLRGVIDRSLESPALNGGDVLAGGPGYDSASYINRDAPVSVSPDGLANDGSAGEGDRVEADVEQIWGGAREDVIVASPAGNGFLFGDLGPDLIVGGPGRDVLSGGGDDAADRLRGAGADDELRGGPGGDDLAGGAGSDVLIGGDGDDMAAGGPDVDALEGGTGSDLLAGGGDADCLHGFVFPARAPDHVFPCPRSDRDTPPVGADGGDVLRGGPGADRLDGGGAEDVADYATDRRGVVVALPGVPRERLAPYGRRSIVADVLAGDVEGIRGGRGDDTLLGNALDNPLDGGPGKDHLHGGPGVDRLRGGSGRDLLVARDGVADAVQCGTKRDFAIADGADEVVALLADVCELVDGGGSRLPGRAPQVSPVGGCTLPVVVPGAGRSFRLDMPAFLPAGSFVHASRCGARVRGAPGTRPGRRAAVLAGGAFALRPRSGGRWLEARLRGGRRSRCRPPGTRLRRLVVRNASPGLLVRGRTLRAHGTGATWVTIDGCRRSRLSVRSGAVTVLERGDRRIVRAEGQR